MSVIAGQARLPLEQVSSHAAFPGLCQLPDRSLLRVWRDAPSHSGGSDGRIFGQYLTENMAELGSPYLLLDWARDLRDPSVSVGADGAIYLTFFSYNTATDPDCKSYVLVSRDGGQTFVDGVEIGAGMASLAMTAPVVETKTGELLAFGYGKSSATETYDSAWQFRSSDNGATWDSGIRTANGPAAGRHYQEPTVIRLRNGALLAALRYGTKDQVAVQASWDDGLTWSGPVPKFLGWGRTSLLEFSTGAVVAVYRGPSPNYPALYRVSNDRGGVWSAAQSMNAPLRWMSYVAMVEVAPGLAACILGTEDSGTESRLEGIHLLDWA